MSEETKNPVGRPRKFKSADDMQVAIDAYFAACDARTRDFVTKEGGVVKISDPEPYTVCGLAIALDLCRDELLEYQKHYGPEFSDTIKKAKMKVQNYAEKHLFEGKNPSGAMFNLKCNYGYRDTQHIDHTSGGDKIDGIKVTFVDGAAKGES